MAQSDTSPQPAVHAGGESRTPAANAPEVAAHRPVWRKPAWWLPALCFLLYNLNFRLPGCGDDLGNRLLPLAILRHATVTLDPYRHLLLSGGELTYHAVATPEGLISIYPIGTAILALPVYFLPAIMWHDFPLLAIEKLTASLMVTVSVGLVYATLRRLGSPERQAVLLGGIYGLATPVFSIGAQTLCQHSPATLGVAATLYCAARITDLPARWVPLAGLAAGATIAIRPQMAAAVVPLVVYVLWVATGKDQVGPAPLSLAAAAAALVPVAAYNWIKTGGLAGGYALAAETLPDVGFRLNPLPGLAGLLASPGRGVLFFAPAVLFAGYGVYRGIRDRDGLLSAAAVGAVATLLLFSLFKNWWGGFTFGPRYLTEVMPLVAVLWRPVQRLAQRTPVWAIFFLALSAYSVGVQVIGAYAYPCTWDGVPESVDVAPSRNWNLSDTPITRCLSEGFTIGGQDVLSFWRDLER